MTELLLRLFNGNKSQDNAAAQHTAIGKLAGAVGIACNIVLFITKLVLGLITGSLSIAADAMNNLTDASSSVITLVGFHMAQRPADKHHPYGHARYEYVSGFVIATLILFIGAELGKSSIERIIHPQELSFTTAAVILMIGSILLKLWMAAFYRNLGKKINSTTLLASSADSRNDVITSLAVLAGFLADALFDINIDGWTGLMVAAFILWSGVGIARETISPLLGRQVDQKLLENIEKLILAHDKILGIHDLLVHDYGPGRYFASVHVELSADEDPQICHDIIDDIEFDALRELDVHLVIHYDPVCTNDAELNEMRDIVNRIIAEINPEFSMHDFRLLRGHGQTRLIFDLAVPYAVKDSQAEIKLKILEALQDKGKNYKLSIHFDGI